MCYVILGVFILLIIRISYLQLFIGGKLSAAASAQRTGNSGVEKPRGDILDRNGIPLTHRSKKSSVVLKPLFFRGKEENILEVCKALGLDYDDMSKKIEIKREPIIIEAEGEKIQKLLKAGIEGVSVVHSLKRYDDNTIAKHVLGYISGTDQVGQAGIEKSYDEVLSYEHDKMFSVITDARSNLIQGLGYRVIKTPKKNEKLNVRLTIDYHIQKIVENILDEHGLKGAVVVEDVYSGDILAMASKPDFDPNDIYESLNSPDNNLFNRAVASYNLGSIFKIIDAACILEKNRHFHDWFECNGYITIGDKEFKCSSYGSGGHGWINFGDAFSKSCNTYFIKKGIETGAEELIEMAGKFGMGSKTGVHLEGIEESAGNIPEHAGELLDGDIANISIGQGSIMATPLQVANLVAAVANGGVRNAPGIVDSILDEDGNRVRDIRRREGERIISKEASNRLKQLMEGVTSEGTGEKARLDNYGGSGGKTGSAETGQYINGEKVVHAWFAGYFPRKTPRYSIVVFVENGKTGSQSAAPIFSQIASQMAKKGY